MPVWLFDLIDDTIPSNIWKYENKIYENHCEPAGMIYILGGGFKYVLFSPYLGKIPIKLV